MLEEDELRWRSGRLRGRWRERISHLSGGHRRMLHEQPSAAAVVRVAKRGKERDAARARRGRHVVGVPIDVVNQRRGGLIERALWALVELAERVALAHLKRWLLLRPRRSGAPRSSHLSACASAGREEELHEVSTPDVLSGGPSWSGLYGPVSWLIFFQFEPHGLVRIFQRESSRVAPMEIRHPGF